MDLKTTKFKAANSNNTKKSKKDQIRDICLIDENVKNIVKNREDLMSEDFPSIWIGIASQFFEVF